MAGYFHPAPFAAQHAVTVDDKGAAFDAAHLLPIHIFHFHHSEQIAYRFVGIRTQLEGKTLLGFEIFV